MTMTNVDDWKSLAIILPNSAKEKNLVRDYCQIVSRETMNNKFAKSCQCCDCDHEEGGWW